MIRQCGNVFILETKKTTYCFGVLKSGHLEHLYYGRKLTLSENTLGVLFEKHAIAPGNTNSYAPEHPDISLEDIRLEMSSYGKGDVREPFVEIVHADGSYTSDFLFDKAEISKGKTLFAELPGSYDESGEVEHLCITLKDKQYHLTLELHYYVYAALDVITRNACLVNDSEETVTIQRLMSTQLDFLTSDYVFTTFTGAWQREMQRNDMPVRAGKLVNATYVGTSSNRANPFVMISEPYTTEDMGGCYGLNLIYSGNHYEAVEVNSHGKMRFVAGMNPQSFAWKLKAGEKFEAPEAVMAYSCDGYNGMSQCMHKFVREHIVRGTWKKKTRPVLLNSWEACYFDITEEKLLGLGEKAKAVGAELLVMDDAWFGERNDDMHSLGDWDVNLKKLPNGVKGICDKINELGLDFGIWVEPEMINVQSKLYEAHPDWAIDIPGKPHSEGRNQRILDFTRRDVQDYIIEKMSEVFSSANIAYVKWDMNRTFTDIYAKQLPADQQGEVAHRYVLGLYRIMGELTKRFPHILFEGCASGGNRFDLGILCYFPQIWASDDTDALCRTEIQTGYSYGYPMSVVSAHVSDVPNHQTLRVSPLETRFQVAAFGVCGYECNLCEMSPKELLFIKNQIALYKEWREVLQWGDFYRGRSFTGKSNTGASVLSNQRGNDTEWTCVSADKKKAVGLLVQKLTSANTQFHYYKAAGLALEKTYHFYGRKLKLGLAEFGSLANMLLPAELREDPEQVRAFIEGTEFDSDCPDIYAGGDALMYGGFQLAQAFSGNGFNEQVRVYKDFASRIYFMEEE